jgi:hypothetical protein
LSITPRFPIPAVELLSRQTFTSAMKQSGGVCSGQRKYPWRSVTPLPNAGGEAAPAQKSTKGRNIAK